MLHIITGLVQGGAETVLYRLISASPAEVKHMVISLIDEGYYGPLLRQRGIEVHALNMPRGRLSRRGLYRLYQIIRQGRPDVVQTWMYHANLVGGITARLAGVRAVVWGIHCLNLDPNYNSFLSRVVGRISGVLSSVVPAATVYVSKQSSEVHRLMGFRCAVNKVIHNGVDLAHFRSSQADRIRLRSEWKVGQDEFLLGFVARWDRYKDHRNLLKALSLLAERSIPFRCALVGFGMDADNRALATLIGELSLEGRMILAGPRADIPAVMNALDLHVLSSAGEAFGNVLAEAMACETPCVTTDVGGAALIVGNAGWVVPAKKPEALAAGIESAIGALNKTGRQVLGKAARQRIEELFGVDAMVQSYLTQWRESADWQAGQ